MSFHYYIIIITDSIVKIPRFRIISTLNFSHLASAQGRRKKARVVRVGASVDALERLQTVAGDGALEDLAPVFFADALRVAPGSQGGPSHCWKLC